MKGDIDQSDAEAMRRDGKRHRAIAAGRLHTRQKHNMVKLGLLCTSLPRCGAAGWAMGASRQMPGPHIIQQHHLFMIDPFRTCPPSEAGPRVGRGHRPPCQERPARVELLQGRASELVAGELRHQGEDRETKRLRFRAEALPGISEERAQTDAVTTRNDSNGLTLLTEGISSKTPLRKSS